MIIILELITFNKIACSLLIIDLGNKSVVRSKSFETFKLTFLLALDEYGIP